MSMSTIIKRKNISLFDEINCVVLKSVLSYSLNVLNNLKHITKYVSIKKKEKKKIEEINWRNVKAIFWCGILNVIDDVDKLISTRNT